MNNLPSIDSAICGIGVIIILVSFYWFISRNKKLNKWLREWDAQHKNYDNH